MNKWILLLCSIVGCGTSDHTVYRPTVKEEEIYVSIVVLHEQKESGHEYLVFKEKFGDGYKTIGVVHSPDCKKCK